MQVRCMGTHRKGQPPPLDVVGVVDLGRGLGGIYILYILLRQPAAGGRKMILGGGHHGGGGGLTPYLARVWNYT